MEVAEMLEGELKDPRIGFATVTRVELSPDLRHGRVLVSVMGGEEQQQATMSGLHSATGYVRREVSRRMRLKRAPDLVFVLDRSLAESDRIEQLLHDLKNDQ